MIIRTISVNLLVGMDKPKSPIWNEEIWELLTGQTTLYDLIKACLCCAFVVFLKTTCSFVPKNCFRSPLWKSPSVSGRYCLGGLWSWDVSWTWSLLSSGRGILMWTRWWVPRLTQSPSAFILPSAWHQVVRSWWLAEQVQVLVEGARPFLGFHNPMLSWTSFSLPGCFFLGNVCWLKVVLHSYSLFSQQISNSGVILNFFLDPIQHQLPAM